MAKTLPWPGASTAFVTKTLPFLAVIRSVAVDAAIDADSKLLELEEKAAARAAEKAARVENKKQNELDKLLDDEVKAEEKRLKDEEKHMGRKDKEAAKLVSHSSLFVLCLSLRSHSADCLFSLPFVR